MSVPPGPKSSTPLSSRHPSDLRLRWAATAGLDRFPSPGRSALLLPACSSGLPPRRWRGLGRATSESRPTQDLDFFTRVGATSVPAARDALEIAARAQAWSVDRVRDEATFCRLVVHGNDDVLGDRALACRPR